MRAFAVVGVGLIVLAAVFALPMAWVLMLALGNFGWPRFGFVDCIPAAMFVSMAFGSARSSSSK